MYRAVTHRCPDCQVELAPARTQSGHALEECPRCGGLWIAPNAFFAVLRAALPEKRIDELMVHNDGTPRRPCPHCARSMDIAWLDFLPLDQCGQHGIWLDPGEFEIAVSGQFSPRELPANLAPKPPKSSDDDARTWEHILRSG
jgi:Zn-finger nucleic acid-binding protein